MTAAPAPGPAARTRHAHAAWLTQVIVAWLLLQALFVALNWSAIGAGSFHDPDDELRLVQVRDLIAGQGWFDLSQYRVASASGGVAMHWSRLVDVPIAAIVLALRPFTGQPMAEYAAVLIVPALTLLAALALVGWTAARTLAKAERPFALIAFGFAAAAVVQLQPMRIDHHGWQIALALAAVATFLVTDPRRGGWLSGAALATWMAISFEGLPFSAWFVAVLSLWSLVDRAMLARLVAVMQSLAVSSLALFVATRGAGDLAAHCDAIAPVHLAMFAWGAAAITLTARRYPHSRAALLAGFTVAGAGALAMLLAAAPRCATGSFDMLDPVLRSYWYDNVKEGKPLWQAELAVLAQYLVPPLIGLWAACTLARRSAGPLREWWIFYALVLAGAIAVSLLVARSAAFSGALAALPLGWRIAAWLGGLRRPAQPLLRMGELVGVAALVFCALLPAIPALAARSLVDRDPVERKAAGDGPACSVQKAAGALAALPAGDILAPLDFGPNVLLYSGKGVLATGHHRGAPAMRQVIDAFTGTPERARAIMRANRLRFVMLCPRVQELDLYRQRAPQGFADALAQGKVPAWLRPVPLPRASGLMLWQVVPEPPVRPA